MSRTSSITDNSLARDISTALVSLEEGSHGTESAVERNEAEANGVLFLEMEKVSFEEDML